MTDIHQWRRMIQPTRTRTPAVDTDESEGFLSPTTPRKGLRPKLSSYFSQHAASAGPSKTDLQFGNDLFSTDLPSWSVDDLAPNPDAERLIDSVMSRLLANPYKSLDIRFNGVLLEIFECYRNINDARKRLQSDLQQEAGRRSTVERAMHDSAQQWDREKQEYKAEVKRLELLLSEGERGLAEVTLARQDSVLRHGQRHRSETRSDKALETIFEFLERTKRYEDKMWSSQRATMKRRPTSPSGAMRRLSKTLENTSPMSNIQNELLFGTPVDVSLLERARRTVWPSPTSNTSTKLPQHAPDRGDLDMSLAVSEPRTSFSDDTLSTFSCAGDLLPDEAADVNLIRVAGTDNDFVAMKRIAQVLAKRRHVDADTIMPKLQELFGVQSGEPSLEKERSNSLPNGLGIQLPRAASAVAEHSLVETNFAKHPRLRTKASEFFSRWRPQLNIDTSTTRRRFSFEPGDDTNACLGAPPLDNLPAAVKDRLLRKSVSLSFLSEALSSKGPQPEPALSPVQQSPTTSAPPSDCRKPSRIPTLVHSNGSLARPRQEREDSASSLLTAIQHADEACQRSDSLSSSAFSSPCASRIDLTQDIQDPTNGTRTAISNPLLEHTNALRGNALAAAAAKAASTITTNVDHGNSTVSAHGKRQKGSGNNGRSSTRSRMIPDMRELRKENSQPMIPSANFGDQKSNATP